MFFRFGVRRTGSEDASLRRRGFELDFCTSLFAFNVNAVGLRKNSAEKRLHSQEKGQFCRKVF